LVTGLTGVLGLTASPHDAWAEEPVFTAPASAGQPALSVAFRGATLRLATCATGTCETSTGTQVALPAEVAARVTEARVSIVTLAKQRHVLFVDVPTADADRRWRLLAAAPLAGGEPQVLFSGFTGLSEGEWGLRHGVELRLSDADEAGQRSVLMGERREDLELCGRPTLLSPKVLEPEHLRWVSAKVQQLDARERDAAMTIVARRLDAPPAAPAQPAATSETSPTPFGIAPELRVIGASSALGDPAALTDGKPETAWAENRGGTGRGEFVLLRARDSLPLSGFELVVRPPQDADPKGVAPREFFLVLGKEIYRVRMPEDAWARPGARYVIDLPRAVTTACVALVTETAWVERGDVDVTFAELSAKGAVKASSLSELVALLSDPTQGPAAAALLQQNLPDGPAAVAKVFPTLAGATRNRAMDVLEAGTCDVRAPLYVGLLFDADEGVRVRATDRLRRCGPAASVALATQLQGDSNLAHQRVLAAELALVDAPGAVRTLGPLLRGEASRRRALRVAFARAAQREEASAEVTSLLNDRALPAEATIDVLRALGASVPRFREEAWAAIERVSAEDPSFATRYLLLEPIAQLAQASHPGAFERLRAVLTDASQPRLQQRAAALVTAEQRLAPQLVALTASPEVRVREEAVRSLESYASEPVAAALRERLRRDDWPLVRRAAAEALGRQAPAPLTDDALRVALQDDSAEVRVAVVAALGQRHVAAAVPELLELLQDAAQPAPVRAAAAKALGGLCAEKAVDALTGLIKPLTEPTSDAEAQLVGSAALSALLDLAPADLTQRLASLRAWAASAPPAVREEFTRRMTPHPQCGKRP